MPRLQFTIGRLMIVTAIAGAIFGIAAYFLSVGPFLAFSSPEPLIAFLVILGIGLMRAWAYPESRESTDHGCFTGRLVQGQAVETRLEIAIEGRSIPAGTACQVLRDHASDEGDCTPSRQIGVRILEGPPKGGAVLIERYALRHRFKPITRVLD